MRILRGITRPVGGEHVLATLPPLGPYASAAAGAPPLRKRLNLFAQRSLTHTALIDEQRSRIAESMRLGQAVAPGIVDGFEVAVEGTTVALLPGHAVAADGSDLELAYPLRIAFDAIGVLSPRVEQELQARHSGPTPWQQLAGWQRQATLAQVLGELGGADFLPHAMVLVALPRTIALDRGEAGDTVCPNATGEAPFSRAAWEDGFQLVWSPWPDGRALPPWTSDGTTVDARFRNRLAYALFNAERERLSLIMPRSLREWRARATLDDAALDALAAQAAEIAARAEPWPWESLGVALSIVAFDGAFRPVFADRAAVVRQGGGRRNRSALVPWSGDDVLWQARVAQLLEHMAELAPAERTAAALQARLDWLPPAGVLSRDAADLIAGRQDFFPPQFDVQAKPVPIDMVDALLAESAPLLPYNLSLRDQVQLLVPVPARFYDPDLLELDLHVHPLFDLEIARLDGERRALLTRRDGLRRRGDLLTQAVLGDTPAYPQDDPNALPDESSALGALAFSRIHRSVAAAGGAELHQFTGAHLRLEFQASDELIVFVRIDRAPAGIGVRPLIGSDDGVPVETRPFVWGEAPAAANGERVGDLPPPAVWTRLSVPMARAGLAGQKIDGLAFAIFGGATPSEVSWGYAGKAASGNETVWLGDALPPGALAGSAASWVWVEQGEPADAAVDLADGLPIEAVAAGTPPATARPHSRHVGELDKLLAAWQGFRDGILTVELGEPVGGRTASTPPRPIEGGLDELIERLDGRIRAAGDHVDFGFLRARTDIFRLRQSVLGVDDAGRFLTSPAAAELVKRNDNPVATEKEFADYFKRLNEVAAAPPNFGATPRSAAGTPRERAAASRARADLSMTRAGRVSVPNSAFALSSGNASLFSGAARLETADALRITPETASEPIRAIDAGKAGVAAGRPTQLSVEAPPAVKDVVGASLLGATYNTVTVAERFTLPASVVSSNSAAKGKNDFVLAGLEGLKASGLAVDDLPVFGYQKAGTGADAKKVTAGELLAGAGTISDADAADVGSDLHEAVYFRRGIDAIDNTIRFLRGMELRAEDYRRLQADAKAARERIRGVAGRFETALAALGLRLAEVRHDLAVSRTLREEEQARIDALIARRKAILAEQVPYLVYRRPRFTLALNDVPVLAAQPADVADPVPRCRADAHDAPPELLAMVDTLRDVPVRWLKPIARVFVKLDRVADLERVVAEAGQRIGAGAKTSRAAAGLAVLEGAGSATGRLLEQTFERQAQRIGLTHEESATRLVQLDASSWKQAIEPVQRIATVRDLQRAGTTQPEVTLAAAGLLDDIAGVAACLHAAFCAVPPATRLRWAELFSQLDAARPLRVLTVLPGFGDESLGVDFIAWRQMQRMVDWLFAQADDEAPAQEAINDLVRVCLLLSAHAPVKRILSARIRRPVPAIVGTRLELEIDPRLTRIGMQVLVYAPATQTLLARAVIDDLASGVASARISYSSAGAGITLDASMRVQVQSGPPLTTPALQQGDTARAREAAVPASAAEKAPAAATAFAAGAATSQRIARQVEALRDRSSRGAKVR